MNYESSIAILKQLVDMVSTREDLTIKKQHMTLTTAYTALIPLCLRRGIIMSEVVVSYNSVCDPH